MRKTSMTEKPGIVAVDIKGLQTMLSLGRKSASDIGIKSGAYFRIGKRVLYKVDKINAYLDTLTDSSTD